MSVRRRWIAASVAVVVGLGGLAAARAADNPPSAPAVASVRPTRTLAVVDMVSVNESPTVSPTTQAQIFAAAEAAGAAAVAGRSFGAGMTLLARNGFPVQQPAPGWRIPMGVTVLPPDAVGRVMSGAASSALAAGQVVMGQTSAALRGAQAGDTIDLVAGNGAIRRFTIGLVADDATVAGAELVMTPQQADLMGAGDVSRVLIWGFRSRAAIDQALAAQGLTTKSRVKIRHSWDLRDPDDTLGLAKTKALLGEFSYTITSSGAVAVSTNWSSAYIPPGRELLSSAIPIRAQCHRTIKPALQAALDEVAWAGLGWAIDVANANTYGGCYYPRFNRLTPSSSLGFLSRHSWGMALDTNTTTNPQGGVPGMDCRVVRIFRKHGFAWGGNFTTPDGMHFEWVGEARDQLPYDSRYCDNPVPLPFTDQVPVEMTQRPEFFSGDGWDLDDHE